MYKVIVTVIKETSIWFCGFPGQMCQLYKLLVVTERTFDENYFRAIEKGSALAYLNAWMLSSQNYQMIFLAILFTR